MSRVDVPTLKCDRCGKQTQNINEMAAYPRLERQHMGGKDSWDLCLECWVDFNKFMTKPFTREGT